jgi:glycosyltransferase involved in cell wall biosynthesis
MTSTASTDPFAWARQSEQRMPVLTPWLPEDLHLDLGVSVRSDALPRLGLRVALVGNALPRRCGIATFTTDLEQALNRLPETHETSILAMNDPEQEYDYPSKISLTLRQNHREDYRAAADFIHKQAADVVCLQHEFGIFGGEAGVYVLDLLERLKVPAVVTLHTVLDTPSPAQHEVMRRLLAASTIVVVMAEKACQILIDCYGANPAQIAVIPHGIPDVPWSLPATAKAQLGYTDKKVILTFGLIGPGKGIEWMLDAMPTILASVPDAVYVVMGATHPHLLVNGQDPYRQALTVQAQALGLGQQVQFINRFLNRTALLEHIAMCDIYVTPYIEEAQMTSGTLAISHGAGRAVVSTPYWHASELLGDGSGRLVPFADSAALADTIIRLLLDDEARLRLARHAYDVARPTTWDNTARRYAQTFARACLNHPSAARLHHPMRVA